MEKNKDKAFKVFQDVAKAMIDAAADELSKQGIEEVADFLSYTFAAEAMLVSCTIQGINEHTKCSEETLYAKFKEAIKTQLGICKEKN